MISRILVPLDGSPVAESILPTVEAFARSHQAQITLFQAVEPSEAATTIIAPSASIVERDKMAAEHAHAYLISIAQRLKQEGFTAQTRVLIGAPAEAIIMMGHEVDLIAMGTHGRSGIGRWVYGSVADKVLHGAAVPILLIRSRAEAPVNRREAKRLLVPLDGSELAEQALPIASEIAKRAGGSLCLVQSVGWAAMTVGDYPYGYGAGIDVVALLQEAEQQAREYLNGLAARLRAEGLAVETFVRDDLAPIAILDVAEKQSADVIVMSTHGRSGIGRWVMGSVADRILRASTVPVLLVRSNMVGGASTPSTSSVTTG